MVSLVARYLLSRARLALSFSASSAHVLESIYSWRTQISLSMLMMAVGSVQLLAPVATTLEGTLMGSEKYTWVGARTVAAAATALGVLTLSSRFHWGLPGVWLGLVSLVACNGLLDGWRLLQKDSPVAVHAEGGPSEGIESVGSFDSLEKAWRREAASKNGSAKVVAGAEPRD